MALNYRTEPFSYRFENQDYLVNDPALSPKGIARGQSDTLVSADPQTPVFVAGAGTPFRLRALHPAGLSEQVFEIHGHAWQEEPYSKGSLQIAAYNPLSQWTGSRDTFGANSAFDAVLAHAGGSHGVKGDYLFRTFIAQNFQNGMWGLLRVGDPGKDVVTVTNFCPAQGSFTVGGVNTVNPSNNRLPSSVTITGANLQPTNVPVDQSTGLWQRSFANAIARRRSRSRLRKEERAQPPSSARSRERLRGLPATCTCRGSATTRSTASCLNRRPSRTRNRLPT